MKRVVAVITAVLASVAEQVASYEVKASKPVQSHTLAGSGSVCLQEPVPPVMVTPQAVMSPSALPSWWQVTVAVCAVAVLSWEALMSSYLQSEGDGKDRKRSNGAGPRNGEMQASGQAQHAAWKVGRAAGAPAGTAAPSAPSLPAHMVMVLLSASPPEGVLTLSTVHCADTVYTTSATRPLAKVQVKSSLPSESTLDDVTVVWLSAAAEQVQLKLPGPLGLEADAEPEVVSMGWVLVTATGDSTLQGRGREAPGGSAAQRVQQVQAAVGMVEL